MYASIATVADVAINKLVMTSRIWEPKTKVTSVNRAANKYHRICARARVGEGIYYRIELFWLATNARNW